MSGVKTSIFVVQLLTIIISVVSIIGNALVCHVIVRLKTMKTSINYIILNLAILDAISGFITIYFVLVKEESDYFSPPVLPAAERQSQVFADVLDILLDWYFFPSMASPILLIAMAYERYKAVVHPFSRLNKTTECKLKIMVLFAWISGIAYTILETTASEYSSDGDSFSAFDIVFCVCLVTQYIIPTIAITLFYLRVICALRKQDNALGHQAEAERARRKSRKKVMWVIIAVTLVFYICCALPNMWHIVTTVNELPTLGELWGEILIILLTINSAFNPFVYFIFIESFRRGFKKVFIPKRFRLNGSLMMRMSVFHSSLNLESTSRGNYNTTTNKPQLVGISNKANDGIEPA